MKKKKLVVALAMTLALCVPALPTQAAICAGSHKLLYSCGGASGGTVGGLTHSYSGGSHQYGKTPQYRKTFCYYCDYVTYTSGDHDYVMGHISGCGSSNGCTKTY